MSQHTTYNHPDIFPKLVSLHIEKPQNINPLPMMKEFDCNKKKSYKDIVKKWIEEEKHPDVKRLEKKLAEEK